MPLHIKVQEKDECILLFIKGMGIVNIPDIQNFGNSFKEHLQGERQFKMFVDLRELSDAPIKVLKYIANYMTKYETQALEKVLGTAILVKSTAIEHLVNLVFTFKKPATPTLVTSTLNEACEFLN